MVGIATITAALVILLSAFNGIEKMIEQLYSEFDPDVTVRASVGKSFAENRLNIEDLQKVEGVNNVSRVLEEIIILKHEDKWVNANLYAVDSSFLSMSHTSAHMIDGVPLLEDGGMEFGLVGATLLDKLGGFIPGIGHETVIVYAAKKDLKIRAGRNPFRTEIIKLNGRFSYNKEINAQTIILPLTKGQQLLDSDSRLTAVYLDVDPEYSNEDVKKELQKLLGADFTVKTNYEKNELIYKTSKSEKLIVLFILLFIFILAAFNLVASLTMLFVEKLENMKAMIAFGASKNFLFRLFFYEGMLISGRGIVIGMLLGYLVCFLQLRYHLLLMPNSGGEPFPISVTWMDAIFIFSLVVVLAVIFTVIPVRFLIRKNIPSN